MSSQLSPVVYSNQRVLTTAQTAQFLGTTEKHLNDNYYNNRDRYTEGKHYFVLAENELKKFKVDNPEIFGVVSRINKFYLWTEKGVLMHVKSVNTNIAWQAHEHLVDTYFRVQEVLTSIPQDGIALTEVIERIQGPALAHLINNPQELHQTIETTKQNIKTLQQNLNLLQVTEQHLYPEQAPKAQIEAPEEVLKRKVLHIMQRKTKAARTKEEQWISPAVVHNQVKYNRYSIEEVEAMMKTLNLEYKKTKHAPRGKYRLK